MSEYILVYNVVRPNPEPNPEHSWLQGLFHADHGAIGTGTSNLDDIQTQIKHWRKHHFVTAKS